jgi:hypothetical protein
MFAGIFGKAQNHSPVDRASESNRGELPPAEAAITDNGEMWEVAQEIGEIRVSKLFVHPIKVGL